MPPKRGVTPRKPRPAASSSSPTPSSINGTAAGASADALAAAAALTKQINTPTMTAMTAFMAFGEQLVRQTAEQMWLQVRHSVDLRLVWPDSISIRPKLAQMFPTFDLN